MECKTHTFFAHETEMGIQASFSDTQGRKNYLLKSIDSSKEQAPIAVESFALEPSDYAELMLRVEAHLREQK